jgi:hypothetical protein
MPALPKFGSDADGLNVGDGVFPPQLQFYAAGNRPLGEGLFTYGQLRALPTRTGALRVRIRRAEVALLRREIDAGVPSGTRHTEILARRLARETRPDAVSISELTTIGDLVATPIPASLRLALFQVARTIPGVSIDAHARDWLGRRAVAVTASRAGFSPVRLLFDPATGRVLGGTSLSETFGQDGTVVAQGAVTSINGLPSGIKPIQAAGARGEPQTPAISPRVGRADTVFNVTLPARAPLSSSSGAPRYYALLTGPAGRGCLGYYPWPSFAQLSPGTRRATAAGTAYTYRLTPPITDASAWCAGRYKVELVAGVLGNPPANTSGIGSATYFQVR